MVQGSRRFLSIALTSLSATYSSPRNSVIRFDDLVIWKLTDELKLNADLEQRFDETLRSVNVRKKSANQRLDQALLELKKAKEPGNENPKALTTALGKYRSVWNNVQKTQTAELDELQKVLGASKFAEYLILKNEVFAKLTEALLSSSESATAATGGAKSTTATPLPKPQLIEEK